MTTFDAAPLDTGARVLTVVTVVLLVAAGAFEVVAIGGTLGSLLGAGLIALVILAWALAPAAYQVQAGDLVVLRNQWTAYRAPLRGFAEMSDPRTMGLRLAGSGGAFGYYGRFRRSDVGRYRAYLTSRDDTKVLAIQTRDGIVTISPANPTAVIQAIRSVT